MSGTKGRMRGRRRKRRRCVKWVCAYLTVTSSVNLSTRCVRMLRGMVPPPSCLWGGLLFRHAGRVELYARAPPTTGGSRPACKKRKAKEKRKMTHAADRNKQKQSRWRWSRRGKRGRGAQSFMQNDQEAKNIYVMVQHKIWFPSSTPCSQFTFKAVDGDHRKHHPD